MKKIVFTLKRAAELSKKKLEVGMFNRFAIFTTILCAAVLSSTPNLQAQKSEKSEKFKVKNIVLVHGAFADGSGWRSVHDILVRDGFHVTAVQEPETAFLDDVAAVRRILLQQDGPTILVAHSYGGSVITEAGTGFSPNPVVGLVYVAAHMPDRGESEAGDGRLFPSALSQSNAMMTTPDGFTFLDPAQFPFFFAADLPIELATFMANSQVFNAAVNFQFVITRPAWREFPSSMVVAGADRIINPDLERFYAARAHSFTVEVPGSSHVVFISHPKVVARVIERAAGADSDEDDREDDR